MRDFLAWDPETGTVEDDAQTFCAFDAEGAAKKWAEHEDWTSEEYSIVSGHSTPVVCVRDIATGELTRWEVSGESVPSYRARQATPEDGGGA